MVTTDELQASIVQSNVRAVEQWAAPSPFGHKQTKKCERFTIVLTNDCPNHPNDGGGGFGFRVWHDTGRVDVSCHHAACSHLTLAQVEEKMGSPCPVDEADTTWFCSAAELRKSAEHRPPVIDGLLWRGDVGNVIAPSKLGKSYFILQLVLSVVSGLLWLGKYATTKGRVLLIDNELHGDTISSRIDRLVDAMGLPADTRNKFDVASLRGRILDLGGLCKRIDKLPKGTFNLIVIDSLYRTMPKGVDENSNADITNIYNRLDATARRQGCAVLVVHHTSKGIQKNKNVIDVGSGAGAQSRAVDLHLVLRPHANAGAVTLEGVVRAAPPIEPTVLVRDFPLWRVEDDLDPKDLRGSGPVVTLDQFLEWFPEGEHKKSDVPEFASAILGVAKRRAKDLMDQAIAKQHLAVSGTGNQPRMIRRAA